MEVVNSRFVIVLLLALCEFLHVEVDLFESKRISGKESFYQMVKNHNGYVSFVKRKPLSFYCTTCALVSSSGQLINKTSGEEINEKDCIIRTNDSPVKGFQHEVGNQTTIRVVAHSSVRHIALEQDRFRSGRMVVDEVNSTIFIVWAPQRLLQDGKHAYDIMKELVIEFPNIKLYIFTRDKMDASEGMYDKETGKGLKETGSFLSTGWFAFLVAMDICHVTYAYGWVNDNHCLNVEKEELEDIPYHYYPSIGPPECYTYLMHERAHVGTHRFMTEKRVFGNWARNHGNIFFRYPEWN